MASSDTTESGEALGLASTLAGAPDDVAAVAGAAPPPSPQATPATAISGLAARPEPDKLARAVARARIAGNLFATKQEVKLGRYHLLEMIGAGGMGVVWGAFDPELDRRVAIKLLRTELAAARARILAEGQALAKLSHPNVVTVHDVGVVDDQIYIVMEWVRGRNLRAHCRGPRTIRELVALYRAAGEGLSAAHRAGLIHRDFKPDNAILGDDGRVRVLDFGLARGEVRAPAPSGASSGDSSGDSSVTRGAGTPRYMPPEQAEGQELTAAADQYAFCVSLREALVGRNGIAGEAGDGDAGDGDAGAGAGSAAAREADVPRWLAEILARGTARAAQDRFPSMDALLHALARDPATVWRRRLIAAGAVAAAGVAFTAGTLRASGPEVEHCIGGRAEIARTWNPAVHARLTAHLTGLGPYGAQLSARLASELADYGSRWSGAHRAACLANERGELTAQLYQRDLACLARARAALEAAVDVLATAPAERLPSSVVASRGLPDAARCLSDAQTSSVDPPPAALAAPVAEVANDVERARVLAVALDPRGVAAAESASRRAQQVGYLPLVAGSRLVHGLALNSIQSTGPGFAALDDAALKALEAGDGATAIEAYARALYAIGVTEPERLPAGAADRLAAVPLVESIAKQLGIRGGFARALLYNNLGTVRLSEGDRERARSWFDEARAVREGTGAAAVELASIWGNLAIVTPDRAERDALFAREAAELEREVGADHPMTLDSRIAAAMFIENPRRAFELARDPCRRYAWLHPHLATQISQCSFEVGWLAEELGEATEARAAMQALQAVNRSGSFEHRIAGGYLLALDGRHAEAAAMMSALAEEVRAAEQSWVRFKAVNAWIAAATSYLRAGQPALARQRLESALALISSSPAYSAGTYRQRRVARVRALLARELAATDRARAAELAAAAATWYRDAGGAEPLVAELDAIATAAGSR